MIDGPTGTGVVCGTSHVREAPPLHRTPRALRCPTYTPIGRAPSDGALYLPTSRRPARVPRDVAFSRAEETVAPRAVETHSTVHQRRRDAHRCNQWPDGVIVMRVGRRPQIPRPNAGQHQCLQLSEILSGTAPFPSFERSPPAPHEVDAASPPSVLPRAGGGPSTPAGDACALLCTTGAGK